VRAIKREGYRRPERKHIGLATRLCEVILAHLDALKAVDSVSLLAFDHALSVDSAQSERAWTRYLHQDRSRGCKWPPFLAAEALGN